MATLSILLSLVVVVSKLCFTMGTEGAPPQRIALVNQEHFHYEIVGGLLHVLRSYYKGDVDVYLNKLSFNDEGNSTVWLKSINPDIEVKDYRFYVGSTYDAVVFISPEYNLPYVDRFIKATRPYSGISIIHNGDFKRLALLSERLPSMRFMTLSPHVAKCLTDNKTNIEVDWMLPIYPTVLKSPCTHDNVLNRTCLNGFVVQGRVEASRRNYTALLDQLEHYIEKDPKNSKNITVHIVGKNIDNVHKNVSQSLKKVVLMHYHLDNNAFYMRMHRAHALVPLFSTKVYFSCKFTSTVLTSVISGTPVMADSRLLRAYSMLNKEAVFFQEDYETEVDVMMRVMSMDREKVWKVRDAVKVLQKKMNDRARERLQEYLVARPGGTRLRGT